MADEQQGGMSDAKKGGIVFFILIGLIIIGGIWAYNKWGKYWWFEHQKSSIADSANIKGKIRGGGDGYLGYAFLTSVEMRKALASQGYVLDWTNDNGAYADRLEKFADGDYDFIALPINSYIKHGYKHHYPGLITAVISDSKGADAVVGYVDKIVPTDRRDKEIRVNDLDNGNLRIAFTPDSPSSFLLDIPIIHFGFNNLTPKGSWRDEVDGSVKALEALKKGMVDAAVLWEPEVSKALETPGVKIIFCSAHVRKLIVDVIVFRTDYIKKNPQVVKMFHQNYFRTIEIYNRDREKMVEEFAKANELSEKTIDSTLKRIDWANLNENAVEWFSLSNTGIAGDEQIIRSIQSIIDIMIKTGDTENGVDPLNGNYYNITDREFVADIYQQGGLANLQLPESGPKEFRALSETEWKNAKQLGSMALKDIRFMPDQNILSLDGKNEVGKIAGMLTDNYPQYRIILKGHTAPMDATEALQLSKERVDAVKKYLEVTFGIDTNRIYTIGVGASEPLRQLPNENMRSYIARLPRVEFILVEDNSL